LTGLLLRSSCTYTCHCPLSSRASACTETLSHLQAPRARARLQQRDGAPLLVQRRGRQHFRAVCGRPGARGLHPGTPGDPLRRVAKQHPARGLVVTCTSLNCSSGAQVRHTYQLTVCVLNIMFTCLHVRQYRNSRFHGTLSPVRHAMHLNTCASLTADFRSQCVARDMQWVGGG